MFENVAQRTAAVLVVTACAAASLLAQAPAVTKMPITTASEEARKLYLEGRDLLERLRGTDARRLFEQAVAKDPELRPCICRAREHGGHQPRVRRGDDQGGGARR